MSEVTNNNNVNTGAQSQDNNNNAEEEKVSYTKAELEALLQREGDKRVSQAMKTMEKKQKESDKLRNMSDEEKRNYELEQREAAIAAKEAELAKAENKSACISILADKGLDVKLVDLVLDEDAEAMNERIKLLDKAFKASVKAEVEKRLGSSAPKKNLNADESMTKEALMKMSVNDIQKFKDENPALFNSLMGR